MERNDTSFRSILRMLLFGILIGAGGILPGISGSVFAVALGIYRPFMEILSRPWRGIPKYWRLLLPVGIGSILGFTLVGYGLSYAFRASSAAVIWLFVGLICGTFPFLWRDAGREGRPVRGWIALVLAGAVFFTALFSVQYLLDAKLAPTGRNFFVCGLLGGLGTALPGMSASPVMMALGIYEPLLEGAAALDLRVIFPVTAGFLAALLGAARFVSWGYRRFYPVAAHGVLGLMIASILCIIPKDCRSVPEGLLCLALFITGAVLSFLFSKKERRRPC